ncbi:MULTISPECIES: hypothetical protein [Pseudoxanthomonas]|uniref:hypothetical protein n=1 Tax=Pseudoxanthomonas TaxID=83618 RepID=UPI001616838C|nr:MULTISPECIES: hypothetical protein [Pseudoxanthomonas]MBB3276334.1 hypothetical protein [Pseudoxanthomonas sp. OG2]MBD9377597.1 hypothetical protein [Pseudoxanthomonas sp. PXM04]MBV7472589.1 hypothetical protein [Pseudoxanthomonas sp. PXM05]UBB25200.1 hypothetical protein LAG73_18020 [Pseudoxanthomonas japonensis]
MRGTILLVFAVVLAGCASQPEYYDTNAAVDMNPLCAGRPDNPNDPVSKDCERTSGVRWSQDEKSSQPLDLSGAKKKDD